MPRVFLSYARTDGEDRAAELRELDPVDFLVLVMTRAAVASGNVQKE
jgi:hypothetical protein